MDAGAAVHSPCTRPGGRQLNDRLYFKDAYLRRFEARVLAVQQRQDGPWLRLSQSAFYPTGGGQPHDTGRLLWDEDEAPVLDVLQDREGLVWHRVDKSLPEGRAVIGEIDWARRFDHMQQHAGEHILAGSLHELTGGFTHGLHIGQADSSIDVTMPDGRLRLSAEEIAALEELANRRVQQDVPIRAWFPGSEELSALPLRKDPTVQEEVRIVAAGDFEMVACGGTHPCSSGQIGLIKVLSTEPARGKLRIRFVCGMRAVRRFQLVYEAAVEAGQRLSAPPEELIRALERQQTELSHAKEQLKLLQGEAAQYRADQLRGGAGPLPGGDLLMRGCFPGADAEELRRLAAEALREPRAVVLLSSPREEGLLLLFAAGREVKRDMAKLLRDSGGRGGGRPDFAQGSAPAGLDVPEIAAERLRENSHG